MVLWSLGRVSGNFLIDDLQNPFAPIHRPNNVVCIMIQNSLYENIESNCNNDAHRIFDSLSVSMPSKNDRFIQICDKHLIVLYLIFRLNKF